MELRVNDYVRTDDGMIAKIEKFWVYHNINFITIDKDTTISESMVLKSSPNIIDLIEVGDYVNGRYVDKYQGKLGNFCELPNGKWEFIKISNEHYLISSIVTREQFESMEYKIGE